MWSLSNHPIFSLETQSARSGRLVAYCVDKGESPTASSNLLSQVDETLGGKRGVVLELSSISDATSMENGQCKHGRVEMF
jgi:hypothetical protein